MFPVLLDLGGYKIYSYGFFIALGYVAGLFLGRRLARERGLNVAPYTDLGFIAILSGLLGARLLFVLTNLSYYSEHPAEALDFWQGGLVFYGGFLFAFGIALLYLKWRKLPILTSLDLMAPSVALAHAFGRIGCLGAGCCHGSFCPYPWGIRLHTNLVEPGLRGQPLHPTQIYEAVALFALTIFLVRAFRRRRFPEGGVAMLYLTLYALIRSLVEVFRGDEVRGFVLGHWLSTSQAIAVLLLFGSGAFLLLGRFRRQNL